VDHLGLERVALVAERQHDLDGHHFPQLHVAGTGHEGPAFRDVAVELLLELLGPLEPDA
jgi:hypothetical protein